MIVTSLCCIDSQIILNGWNWLYIIIINYNNLINVIIYLLKFTIFIYNNQKNKQSLDSNDLFIYLYGINVIKYTTKQNDSEWYNDIWSSTIFCLVLLTKRVSVFYAEIKMMMKHINIELESLQN